MTERLERLAPLAGVGFFVLIVATFAATGSTPNNDDSTAKIVRFWQAHDTQQFASAFLVGLAALVLVWFAASLRRAIWRAEGGDGRLAGLAFAGAAIAAVGLLIVCSLTFAAVDTAGTVPGVVTHTITVLSNELFFPVTGGFALMLAAAGLAFVRTGVLPRWLGWVSIVVAIAAITPAAFFAILASVLWVGAVGLILYLRPVDRMSEVASR
jgi:hypothetical protein